MNTTTYIRPSTIQNFDISAIKTKQTKPSTELLIKTILNNRRFIVSGPIKWQEIFLGQKCAPLWCEWVYNDYLEGEHEIQGTVFKFFKREYPEELSLEWWTIDLINHYLEASLPLAYIPRVLKEKIDNGILKKELLLFLAEKYGELHTKHLVKSVINDQ